MKAFESFQLKDIEVNNRVVRAATYEGLGDLNGVPQQELGDLYERLCHNGVDLIITGFNFISKEGRAMQPRQCGIDSDDKIEPWSKIADRVNSCGSKIVMQISHGGRQVRKVMTGSDAWAPSKVKCTYFRETPKVLTEDKIEEIIESYAQAALRAKRAGINGVQIHAAHGYLIHQFFCKYTNRRKDKWGSDKFGRFLFFKRILERTRELCGDDFLVITKISCGDDRGYSVADAIEMAQLIEQTGCVSAIEVSYGTMEFAMNIFRGGLPLDLAMKHNPLFNRYPKIAQKLWKLFVLPLYKMRLKPFSSCYNLEAADKIARAIKTPVWVTGGVRSGEEIENILGGALQAVTVSRPYIREENFLEKLKEDHRYKSTCVNCNMCAIMCDSTYATRCFWGDR